MNSHREAILQAATVLLTGATPAGAQVFRSRMEALRREELPAIVVRPGAEEVEHLARGIARRSLDLHIEVHARGTPADSMADPVVTAAHAVLMADATLGGRLARLIEKGMAVDFADGDDTAVMVTTTYMAVYATTPQDITTPI